MLESPEGSHDAIERRWWLPALCLGLLLSSCQSDDGAGGTSVSGLNEVMDDDLTAEAGGPVSF